MKKMNRILTLTAAAVVAAQTGFAQTTAPTPTPTPAPAPAPINLDFLGALFAGDSTLDEQGIRDAFSSAGLTVERYRASSDGEVRVRATTADGQEVRIRVEDGEVRYRLKSGGDSTDDNGPTSDDNGDTSDSNGDDTSDGNGGKSGGGNGGDS